MPDLKLWGEQRLSRLRQDLDRLYDDLCLDLGLGRTQPAKDVTLADAGDVLVVTVALPGAVLDDLDLTVDERVLTIRQASRRPLPGGVRQDVIVRTVRLPCRVRPQDASAVMRAGAMEIRLPKCLRPCQRRVLILTK